MSLIKLKTSKQITESVKPIIPTPTEILKIKTEVKYNGKTKEEILKMEPEEDDSFITELSREEVEELNIMPDYDFSDFLPEKKETFIAEKYDPIKRELIIQPLVVDKEKIINEMENWLFYETGNNPKTIKIIWKE